MSSKRKKIYQFFFFFLLACRILNIVQISLSQNGSEIFYTFALFKLSLFPAM